MRVVSIVGARPQFISCAPLSKELRRNHDEIVDHAGHRYDYAMSKVFFHELYMPGLDYSPNVGSDSQGHQVSAMLSALEGVLLREGPQMVVVFGDTNSMIVSALAASKLGLPVAHVGAGLRSFDGKIP
jgi:UDP-N-acetylglucosamine 2-epimerase (non-hydrolysing)